MDSTNDLGEYRIAGLRINPNNFGPSRAGSYNGISIKNIRTGATHQISGLPSNPRISSVQWSPAQDRFAFTNNTNTAIAFLDELGTKFRDRVAD